MMASQAPIPLHAEGADSPAENEDDRITDFDEAEDVEPVRPSAGARRQALQLVGRLPSTQMLAGGVAAVLLGGAVGYWLGARSARRPVRQMRRAASSVEHAVELLPVTMQLLANPLFRSLIIKLALRRLAS